MGTKENPGRFDCYESAKPDEPMFVLLARDPLAADLVREWSNRRETDIDHYTSEKAVEARACADAMDAWREKHPGGWMVTATLPKEKYRVIEKDDGWDILTEDDHGAYS